MTLRLVLPKWFFPAEIGLGEIIKKGSAAIGVKPCAPCLRRAERLNRLVVLAPAGTTHLALPPIKEVQIKEATGVIKRPRGHEVEHLPQDEGTPDTNSERCCTFAVTLSNKRRPKPAWWPLWMWPWLQARTVRVTATGTTTIVSADPDQWQQVSNFPSSVTWDPGTGGAIPPGDATDSWNIDNDFVLSLGPVSNGLKTIKIEWLNAGGIVLDAFQVSIPCALEDKVPDIETNWEGYTSVISGGTSVFAYLEPDDCDSGDLDYRAACSITYDTPTCTIDGSGNNAYSVTFHGSGGAVSYMWSKDNEAEIATTATNWTTTLKPGQHSVRVRGLDGLGKEIDICSADIELVSPLPDFSVYVDGCKKQVFLNGGLTDNANQVVQWTWLCSNSSIQIPPFMTPPAIDFSTVADGSYDITLRVKDKYGCWWEQTQNVEVGGCRSAWAPKYSWCMEKIDPTLHKNVDVSFDIASEGCAPFTCQWDYGDGSTGTQASHIYVGAAHGQQFPVTLTVTDSAQCVSVVSQTLTIAQRLMPQFTLRICPDGKVICETNEPGPDWTPSDSPDKAPWPYSKKNKSRVIYRYMSSGSYSIMLTSTNDNGNECQSRKFFDFHFDCCAKNTHTRGTSDAQSVALNGTSYFKVIGKLRQRQSPLWHRVIAKTILKKQNSHGKWRRFKSPDVRLEVAFDGVVYRSEEEHSLAFDGPYFKGCNCVSPATTSEQKEKYSRRKIRVVDGLGGPFRSKIGSLTSHHRITVGGTTYPLLDLSLGKESDCDHWHWWGDWFFSEH